MNTYTLAQAVAAAIAADTATQTYCSTTWGRALRVCCDALGHYEDPAETAGAPYPYVVVGPSGDDSGGPEAAEQTREIAALVVIDASRTAAGDFADPAKPRLETTGIYTVGQGAELAALVEHVQTAIRAAKPGSILRRTRIVWNGIDSLPVQFAAVIAEYYEAKAFGDW